MVVCVLCSVMWFMCGAVPCVVCLVNLLSIIVCIYVCLSSVVCIYYDDESPLLWYFSRL